ncbi:MATE family efflux transporter [Eubacterium sp. ER2]|uniref:MATE family efflux transporter n=1 Tax=Eubacterium sp. ER2 TaxID=1519438 RepID=UPI00051BB350
MKGKKLSENILFDNYMLAALIIPLVAEQMLAVLVGMADSIMVAEVGEEAVSGVSLVDTIMVLLNNAFSALAAGGAVVAGQLLGHGRRNEAQKAADQLVRVVTICAVITTTLIYIGRNWILCELFGQIDRGVMRHAETYLLIVAASIPFVALYNGGAAIFRIIGAAQAPMYVSLIMNVINISGNAMFIYGFHRGTEGVAVPTLFSRIVGALLIVILLQNKKRELHLNIFSKCVPDRVMICKILSIGIPNGLENGMFQLGKIIVLSLISTFGTYAIAANAVANIIGSFQVLPGMAITLAVNTVIARCVGAGDYIQVRYFTGKLMKITYICLFIINLLIVLLLPFILEAYHLSDRTEQVASVIVVFYAFFTVMIWPAAFTVPAVLRAAGDARVCLAISVVSMWIFRIIFSYILARATDWGIYGVWVAMIIDWIVRSICFALRYFSGRWKQKAVV